MGESNVVTAQRLANEANVANTQNTNQTNLDIANKQIDLQLQLQREQNQWNLEQWNRENEYNSPAAQMERYIKAGINPIFALGGMDSGNSAHLESAGVNLPNPPVMDAPQVQPEYDPYLSQHIANINTAARDVVNGMQGFMDLALKGEDVETRRAAQITRSDLDRASALETRAKTKGQELTNEWTTATLSTRIHEESQKLQNLFAQERNLNADTEEAKAKRLEIEENKKFITQRIQESIANIRQRDFELSLKERGLQIDAKNAETNRLTYNLSSEKFEKEVQQWNNQNLLQFMYKFGRTITGSMNAKVGVEGLGISGSAGVRETTPADIAKMQACGITILQRAADNPTEENLKYAEEASKIITALEKQRVMREVIPVDALFNSTNSSILNPSERW